MNGLFDFLKSKYKGNPAREARITAAVNQPQVGPWSSPFLIGDALERGVANARNAFHENIDPEGRYTGITAPIGAVASAVVNPLGKFGEILDDLTSNIDVPRIEKTKSGYKISPFKITGRNPLLSKIAAPYDTTAVPLKTGTQKMWDDIETIVSEQNRQLFSELSQYRNAYKQKYGRMPSTKEIQSKIYSIRRNKAHLNVAEGFRYQGSERGARMPNGSPSYHKPQNGDWSPLNWPETYNYNPELDTVRPWNVYPSFGPGSLFRQDTIR